MSKRGPLLRPSLCFQFAEHIADGFSGIRANALKVVSTMGLSLQSHAVDGGHVRLIQQLGRSLFAAGTLGAGGSHG